MIRIDVKDYCHACMDFSPDVTKPVKYYGDTNEILLGDTIVQCEHARRCEAIRRYLENQIKSESEAVG